MFKKRENVAEIEEGNLLSPRFDNDGLIPVVTTCANTKEVLMHGYMNVEALKLTIETNYIEGPLKDLTTNWKFEEINNNKSKIIFNVNFEFKNFIHQKVAETFYPLIENKMINSFKERADSFLD